MKGGLNDFLMCRSAGSNTGSVGSWDEDDKLVSFSKLLSCLTFLSLKTYGNKN